MFLMHKSAAAVANMVTRWTGKDLDGKQAVGFLMPVTMRKEGGGS